MTPSDVVRTRLSGRFVPAKRWVHRRFVAQTAMRPFILARGVRALDGAFTGNRDVDAVARLLAKGWGNPQYAAAPELIASIIREVATQRGPIVECGSGVTSVVLAAARRWLGERVVTIEHDDAWAVTVRRRLHLLRLPYDGVLHRPLTARDGYEWYCLEPDDVPSGIGLVICDGPPASTPGGRTGVVEIVGSRGGPEVVILDDTDRAPERELCETIERMGYERDDAATSATARHVILRRSPGSDA